jgi:hypothetical protein
MLRESLSSSALVQRGFERAVRRQCPPVCTTLKYNVVVKERQHPKISNIKVVNDFETFFAAGAHMVEWRLALMTSTVTTVTQYFSYEMSQFLGELGGSWGLFLGASLLSILDMVQGFMAKMLLRKRLRTH